MVDETQDQADRHMKRLHEEADFDVEEARAALASAEESLTSAQITLRQAKARRDGLDR